VLRVKNRAREIVSAAAGACGWDEFDWLLRLPGGVSRCRAGKRDRSH
jgi:hypothetical protein